MPEELLEVLPAAVVFVHQQERLHEVRMGAVTADAREQSEKRRDLLAEPIS